MSKKLPKTIAKEQTLALLYTTIERYAGKEFKFKIAGCLYNVGGGVFNQVDFYRKVAIMKSDNFLDT